MTWSGAADAVTRYRTLTALAITGAGLTGAVAALVAVRTRRWEGLEAVLLDGILVATGVGLTVTVVLSGGLLSRRRWAPLATIVTFGGSVVVGTAATIDVVQRVVGSGATPLRDVLLPIVFSGCAVTALAGAVLVQRRS